MSASTGFFKQEPQPTHQDKPTANKWGGVHNDSNTTPIATSAAGSVVTQTTAETFQAMQLVLAELTAKVGSALEKQKQIQKQQQQGQQANASTRTPEHPQVNSAPVLRRT